MSTFLLAAGSADLTPDWPVPLAGFSRGNARHTAVVDPLEANAVLLRQGDAAVLWVALDVLYAGPLLRGRLDEELGSKLDGVTLILGASHTHFAPATDPTKPRLGAIDDAYVSMAVRRVAALISSVLDVDPTPVTLHRGEALADHGVNRRSRRWRITRRGVDRSVRGAPSKRGPRDERVHVLEAHAEDGSVPAVIWQYACHPVCSPEWMDVSADFPGVVRRRLRTDTGPGSAVLFLQGFSGDIRPSFVAEPHDVGARIRAMVNGPEFAHASTTVWEEWATTLADVVAGARTSGLAPVVGPLEVARHACPLSELLPGADTRREVVWHRIGLGPGTSVWAVSAEVVSEYAELLPEGAIPVGCVGDTFGYYPTDRMVAEGGYESHDFLPFFDLPGGFSHDLEALFREAVAALDPDAAG